MATSGTVQIVEACQSVRLWALSTPLDPSLSRVVSGPTDAQREGIDPSLGRKHLIQEPTAFLIGADHRKGQTEGDSLKVAVFLGPSGEETSASPKTANIASCGTTRRGISRGQTCLSSGQSLLSGPWCRCPQPSLRTFPPDAGGRTSARSNRSDSEAEGRITESTHRWQVPKAREPCLRRQNHSGSNQARTVGGP